MKTMISSLIFSTFLAATPLLAAEQTVTFDVPGMTCPSCPFIVQSAMGSIEGVLSVEVDLASKTAVVVFEDTQTTTDAIAQASAMAGYEAILRDGQS